MFPGWYFNHEEFSWVHTHYFKLLHPSRISTRLGMSSLVTGMVLICIPNLHFAISRFPGFLRKGFELNINRLQSYLSSIDLIDLDSKIYYKKIWVRTIQPNIPIENWRRNLLFSKNNHQINLEVMELITSWEKGKFSNFVAEIPVPKDYFNLRRLIDPWMILLPHGIHRWIDL